MRVVYDISILGHGFRSEPSRTGVFRVIDRTMKGLENHPDVSLRLSSAESWENLYWSERFLKHADACHSHLLIPRGPAARALYHAQDFLYDDSARRSRNGNRTTRIVRRLTGAITSRTSSLPRSAVVGRDIFHSGFHALPSTTNHVKGLRRFVTVYDLIPVLLPQFFADGISVGIREIYMKMLRTVGRDDYVLAISEATKHDLCSRLTIDPSHVFVSPLAAAPDLFYLVTDVARVDSVRARYGLPVGAQYLLSVNTLEPRKNMEHALDCFASVVSEAKIEDLYFVLVGTRGWDFQSILRAIDKSKIAAERVILTGYVPDEDLAPLYTGALAFVYPSYYEGFGLPPLEAMQCGTPVITSNTSSLPEVVGDAGIMVSPTDQDALCQAMLDMYRKPALRAGFAARSVVRSKYFSWERYTNEVVSAYRSALSA